MSADVALAPEWFAFKRPDDLGRFLEKVEVDPNSGCWLWTAALDVGGYGKFALRGGPRPAHRVAYTNIVGPVPSALALDHKCRTRCCVNPAHLRVVTRRQNVLLNSISAPAANVAKTACANGHPYSPENTYRPPATPWQRQCVACRETERLRASAGDKARRLAAGGRGHGRDRTHCGQGHPLSGDNLYVAPGTGYRDCRTCRAARSASSVQRLSGHA